MTEVLPGVGIDTEPTPCYQNKAFYQVRSVAEGRILAEVICAACPAIDACRQLAVATKERYGVLYGVWAGRVYTPDGSDRK